MSYSAKNVTKNDSKVDGEFLDIERISNGSALDMSEADFLQMSSAKTPNFGTKLNLCEFFSIKIVNVSFSMK
jgi:hypothetical protein